MKYIHVTDGVLLELLFYLFILIYLYKDYVFRRIYFLKFVSCMKLLRV